MKTKQIIKALREEAARWFEGDCPSNGVIQSIAADRLEMLSVMLKNLNYKQAAMKKELEWAINCIRERGGCAGCKHQDKEWDAEPCSHCFRCSEAPEDKWEWMFAKDTDVPIKKEDPDADSER